MPLTKIKISLTSVLSLLALIFLSMSFLEGISQIGQVHPGFTLTQDGQVSSLLHPQWSGAKQGLKLHDQILYYNDKAFRTSQDFQAELSQKPNQPITYQISRHGETITLVIPSQILTWQDFLLTYGSCFLVGMAFIATGSLIFFLRPQLPGSLAFFLTSYGAGLAQILLVDHYTQQNLTLFYLLSLGLFAVAQPHNAVTMHEIRPFFQKRPRLWSFLYGSVLILALIVYGFRDAFKLSQLEILRGAYNFIFPAFVLAHSYSFFIFLTTKSQITKKRLLILLFAFLSLVPAFAYYVCREYFSIVLPHELILFQLLYAFFIPLSIIRFNAMEFNIQLKRSVLMIILTLTLLSALAWDFLFIPAITQKYGHPEILLPTLFAAVILQLGIFSYIIQNRVLDRLFFYTSYQTEKLFQDLDENLLLQRAPEDIAKLLKNILTKDFRVSQVWIYLALPDQTDFVLQKQSADKYFPETIPKNAFELTETNLVFQSQSFLNKIQNNQILGLSPTNTELVLPIFFRQNCLGYIFLDKKSDSTLYNPEDIASMRSLFSIAGIALANASDSQMIIELQNRLKNENRFLRDKVQKAADTIHIIGEKSGLQEIFKKLEAIRDSTVSVLIFGESGTGKEVVARAIHNRSIRSQESFIAVNCAAIPENLLESEFFGHEKGAFTGATETKIGLFELANKGTLFLDEIGDLPLSMQAKFLRVLQEREIKRVGSNKIIKLDIRVVSATNRHLEDMITKKKFREDLFYRLNVLPIFLPPLRRRMEDLDAFLHFFIRKFATEMGKHILFPESHELKKLKSYPWPGNVRELQNIVERAVALCPDESRLVFPSFGDEETASKKNDLESIQALENFHKQMDAFQDLILQRALHKANGNKAQAARDLGIHVSHLYKMMKQES